MKLTHGLARLVTGRSVAFISSPKTHLELIRLSGVVHWFLQQSAVRLRRS
jgi:hypothetical protein